MLNSWPCTSIFSVSHSMKSVAAIKDHCIKGSARRGRARRLLAPHARAPTLPFDTIFSVASSTALTDMEEAGAKFYYWYDRVHLFLQTAPNHREPRSCGLGGEPQLLEEAAAGLGLAGTSSSGGGPQPASAVMAPEQLKGRHAFLISVLRGKWQHKSSSPGVEQSKKRTTTTAIQCQSKFTTTATTAPCHGRTALSTPASAAAA